MKKKLLAILLVLAMMVSLLTFPVTADSVDVLERGSYGDNLTWTLTEDGTLTISGTGDMADIEYLDYSPWWEYRDTIIAVIIEDGVTSIGECAFRFLTSLTSVTIPDSVTTIGWYAFYSCDSLTSITIPDSVTFIDSYAFAGCGLTSITIPDSVTSISTFTFWCCYDLKEVNLGSGITSIETWAFLSCTGLTSIVIPANVTRIEGAVFENCTNLAEIWFEGSAPEFVEGGYETFEDLTLTIYYPDNDASWTEDIMQDYGGTITWVPYTPGSTGDTEETEELSLAFSDVSSSEYYYDAVQWAVENGVTTGTTSSTFSPDSACTRAQVVTFLYRAAGEPSVSGIENPFTDVSSGDYYYNAVLWAVENGITTGTTASTFSPEDTCTRGQVVTFLYRYAGTGVAEADNPFTDVSSSEYYYNAVLWAVENGVTTGTTTSTFSPENSCTRAHVVTFLYRALSE